MTTPALEAWAAADPAMVSTSAMGRSWTVGINPRAAPARGGSGRSVGREEDLAPAVHAEEVVDVAAAAVAATALRVVLVAAGAATVAVAAIGDDRDVVVTELVATDVIEEIGLFARDDDQAM